MSRQSRRWLLMSYVNEVNNKWMSGNILVLAILVLCPRVLCPCYCFQIGIKVLSAEGKSAKEFDLILKNNKIYNSESKGKTSNAVYNFFFRCFLQSMNKINNGLAKKSLRFLPLN